MSTNPEIMTTIPTYECTQCGVEFPRKDDNAVGTKHFCCLEHQLEYSIFMLQAENRDLTSQLHLLNAIRTGHWPDAEKTVEANEQMAIFQFKQNVVNMTDDQIMVYSKMIRAIDIQCQLVITKQGIKVDHDKKAKGDFKRALEKRDETTLPLSPLAKAREKFYREHKKQGFSEAEADKLWKVESVKEKAILAFMKMPGFTREMAENLAMSSLQCTCGHQFKVHVGGKCHMCTCEAFSNKGDQ